MASSSAAASLAMVALLVASCAATVSAATITVGDSQGWTTGVDYNSWVNSKTFAVGDTLVFNYASKAHTVTEVGQSGYQSCSGSNALGNDDSGSTSITLTAPGTRYFICNVPGHCAAGMKLAVPVGSSASGSPGTPSGAVGPTGAAAPAPPSSMAAAAAAATALVVKIALFG